jgi:hypothetical protein
MVFPIGKIYVHIRGRFLVQQFSRILILRGIFLRISRENDSQNFFREQFQFFPTFLGEKILRKSAPGHTESDEEACKEDLEPDNKLTR